MREFLAIACFLAVLAAVPFLSLDGGETSKAGILLPALAFGN